MGSRVLYVTFDCTDPRRVAEFWAEVVGYELRAPNEEGGEVELHDPTGAGRSFITVMASVSHETSSTVGPLGVPLARVVTVLSARKPLCGCAHAASASATAQAATLPGNLMTRY